MLLAVSVFSQAPDWNTQGNIGIIPANGDMLGTTDNTPIPFRTDDVERMRLWQSTSQLLNNGTPNPAIIDQAGFLGISRDGNLFTGDGPFSLLHLNGLNDGFAPQERGYRSWMQYGLTFTHNRDMMFVGPRQVNDSIDPLRRGCPLRS